MDAMSLEDLEENFLSKCKAQSLYLELRDYGEDETCIQQMMVSSFSSLIRCFQVVLCADSTLNTIVTQMGWPCQAKR